MEETVKTERIDKNTIKVTRTKTEVVEESYIYDDIYDQIKQLEQSKQDFSDSVDVKIEQLKQILSDADSAGVSPVDQAKKAL